MAEVSALSGGDEDERKLFVGGLAWTITDGTLSLPPRLILLL